MAEQGAQTFRYIAVPTRTEMIIIPTIFFVIGLVFFTLRIQARRAVKALGIDDLFLALAVLLGLVVYVGAMVGIHYGIGKHLPTVSPSDLRAFYKLIIIQGRAYSWGISFLKIGLAYQLMRIKGDSRVWRWGLWTMIICIVIVLIISEILFWLVVRPISAMWDPSKQLHAKLLPLSVSIGWSYAFSSWNLFSDVVFALSPILFIRKMNQPLREKVVLTTLMALGLLCAACGAPRLIALKNFAAPDPTYMEAGIVFWSDVEYFVGVCAVCAPTLRCKFEAALRAMGFKLESKPAPSNSRWYGHQTDSSGWRRFWGSNRSNAATTSFRISETHHDEESPPPACPVKGEDTWREMDGSSKHAPDGSSDDGFVEPEEAKSGEV